MQKKKSKKPKHLKRKLATVSGDDDREHLLHVLKEFERKKSNLSGPPAKKSRPSPENERIVHAPRISTQDELKVSVPKEKVETKEKRASVSKIEVSTEDAKKEAEVKSKQKKANQDEVKAAVPQGKIETKENRPSASAAKKKPNQSGPASKKAKPSLGSKSTASVAADYTKQEATTVSPEEKKNNEPSASPLELATGTEQEKKPSKAPAKPPPAAKSPVLNDDDDSSDSDSDGSVSAEEPSRQRGKRRRGRQDTSKQILEKAPEEPTASASSQTDEPKDPKAPDPAKKTMKKDDKRFCVGRKPVTDFSVGQKYDAKVVYIKPFGIFMDIGSHSDAFCHVSRLQDDFIESPDALYKEGDTVSARVVEIDRRKKRITVSLQSDAKMEDERSSVEAHAKRREKHRGPPKNAQSSMEEAEHKSEMESESFPVKQQPTTPTGLPTKPESEMNQAELKRARKLARRAARRQDVETQADE